MFSILNLENYTNFGNINIVEVLFILNLEMFEKIHILFYIFWYNILYHFFTEMFINFKGKLQLFS